MSGDADLGMWKKETYLPQHQPALGSSQQQHVSRESYASYPLMKRNKGFLSTTLA